MLCVEGSSVTSLPETASSDPFIATGQCFSARQKQISPAEFPYKASERTVSFEHYSRVKAGLQFSYIQAFLSSAKVISVKLGDIHTRHATMDVIQSSLRIEGTSMNKPSHDLGKDESVGELEKLIHCRTLTDLMYDGFIVIDENNLITYVNSQFARMLDYNVEEIINRPLTDFGQKETIDSITEHIKMRKEGFSSQYEIELIQRSGSKVMVIVSGTPVTDDDGVHRGSFAVITDITTRIQAEETIKQSELKFRTLFQESPIGILTCDTEGHIQQINKVGLDLLGSPSEEATKQINLLTFPPIKKTGFSDDLVQCVREKIIIVGESPYVSKWRKPCFLRYKIAPICNDEGEVDSVLCTFDDISALKKAEEKLSLYKTIITHSSEAIAILDKMGVYLEQNAAHHSLLGYSDEMLQGKTPAVHLGDDVFSSVFREMEKFGQFRGEVKSQTNSGKIIDIDMASFVLRDDAGNPAYYVGIKRDVTERKLSEQKLRESEEKYYTLFDSAPIALVMTNEEGCIIASNQAMVNLIGYSKEEFENMNVGDLYFDHEERAQINKLLDRTQAVCDFDVLVSKKDGTSFNALLNIEIEKHGGLVAIRDITSRRYAEDALRESEELYRLHFENVTDVILSLDMEGTILKISPSVEKYIGFTPDQLTGKKFLELGLITPEYLGTVLTDFNQMFAGEPVSGSIYEFISRDGNVISGEVSGASLKRGEKVEAVVIIRDVTERVMVEKALRAAKDSALLYIDVMGHDLNNQFQAIIGGSALLKTMISDSSALSQLKQVKESAEKSARIVQKVKKTQYLLEEELQPRLFGEVLINCIENTSALYSDADIQCDIIDSEALIDSDKFLEVLVQTLLENAIEHNPHEGKKVWVSFSENEESLMFSISDNGLGIPDSQKKDLFDISRRFGGVGVHQVRQIVEKYNGHIEVLDRVKGDPKQGVKFRVQLPKTTNLNQQ